MSGSLGSSQTQKEGSGTGMAQERAPSSEKPLLAETPSLTNLQPDNE